MISNEVKAAQEAYAARPFAVRWEDSHSALTNRFHTFDEAYAYMQHMVAVICKTVAEQPHRASDFYRSFIETPAGRIPVRYYILADDVSSYR